MGKKLLAISTDGMIIEVFGDESKLADAGLVVILKDEKKCTIYIPERTTIEQVNTFEKYYFNQSFVIYIKNGNEYQLVYPDVLLEQDDGAKVFDLLYLKCSERPKTR